MISNEERTFLLELQMDPRWGSVLKKLRRDRVAPWKKGVTLDEYANESGKLQENERLLKILGVNND